MDIKRKISLQAKYEQIQDVLLPSMNPYSIIPCRTPLFSVNYRNLSPFTLLTSGESGTINIITIDNSQNSSTSSFNAHFNTIFDSVWSADDTRILTASGDLLGAVWDSETFENIARLKGHGGSLKCIKQAPNNESLIATASRDGLILLWDLRTASAATEGREIGPVASVSNSANSIIYRGGRKKFAESYTGLEFIADGVIVAGISAYDADIRLWDIRKMRTSSKPTEKLSQARFITSIDPLTNLRLNLSKIIKSSPEEQSNFIKKYTSGLDIETLERISAGNSWIFKSPDSSSLLVSAVSNIIYVYENIWSIDLAPPKEYHDHRASFFIKPCISPDGRYLACGSTDGSIALWNLRTDNFIGKLTNAHTGEVNAVAWSEGCEGFIASVSDDENLIIWSYEE